MADSPEVSRRQFIVAAGAGLLVGGGAVAAYQTMKSSALASPASPGIDPNTIRRRGVGFRGYDPQRASPGFTLFAPSTGGGMVYLIDIQGNVTHTWKMPYPPGLYGYLTEKGTLLYNGQIPNETFLGKSPFMGGAVMEADWNGKVLWEIKQPDHHHDGRLLRNGNVLLLCSTDLPADIAKQVKGGLAGSEHEGKIGGDYLEERTTDGKKVWEWRTWEHMDPAAYPITSPSDSRSEWTHGNGIAELPDGNILLSFRNISTVVRINRQTGAIDWKLGAPPLAGQHAPTPLRNGNILLFDNGPFRADTGVQPFSRVLEINPGTKEVVWKYQDGSGPGSNHFFFSSRVSNAQRLPNGNTLINEGLYGRFFEVTTEGDVVWEYVNPHFGPATAAPKAQMNNVFRVYRYSAEEIAAAQKVA
ncbi:MAG TPA: aryl-sulfate sulfotransferase [Bryobacteraceae bacterium]|nr:aryl-sulfate sulfotransferase [Bryobacteraceae bacterium]